MRKVTRCRREGLLTVAFRDAADGIDLAWATVTLLERANAHVELFIGGLQGPSGTQRACVRAATRTGNDLRPKAAVIEAVCALLDMLLAPTDVSHEVRRAVESIRNVLESADLELELTLAPVVVLCDAARIRQAVLALLDNARRYARPGYLRIGVRTTDERVLIRIEDAGPGLSEDFAPHAFDPFTRAEASRSRVSGGTGLGLSVVRAIAMAHQGDVRYERSTEGGAIFQIELPN